MNRGTAAAFTGLAIFAAAAGWLYYDYMRIPPDVVAAYEAFVDEGDPLPLAALGDRAQGVVPQLAEVLETTADRQRRDDAALLLGVIGGPEAVDALIKRLDHIEANHSRHRFRSNLSDPVVFALAMQDSPRGAERLLTYHFESEMETVGLGNACFTFETIPDDPDLVLRAMRSPTADADRIVVLNLASAMRILRSRPHIQASEEIDVYLTEHHRRFMTSEAPWFILQLSYIKLLGRMTAPRARAFVDVLPEKYRQVLREPAAPPAFESADDIADAYEDAGGTWRIKPERYVSPETDFSDVARLAALLNADPSPDAWRLMTPGNNEPLRRMGASITPFLITCLERTRAPSMRPPDSSVLQHVQLERLYLLRRATGRNFGLNPEAWRTWWEREGRAEFEGGR